MFDPLNQNGDDEIDFSEKNLFEGLPVDEICKNTVDFPEEEFKKPEKGEEEKEEETKTYLVILKIQLCKTKMI